MQSAIRLFRDTSSDSSSGDSGSSTLSDILGAIPGALTGTAAIIAATNGNNMYRYGGTTPYPAPVSSTPSYLIWIIVAVVLLVVVMLIAKK